MKFLRFMNIIFYIITIFLIYGGFVTFFNLSNDWHKIGGFVFGLVYFLSFFYHIELRKEILKTYYIDKEISKDPTDYMVEEFKKKYHNH